MKDYIRALRAAIGMYRYELRRLRRLRVERDARQSEFHPF